MGENPVRRTSVIKCGGVLGRYILDILNSRNKKAPEVFRGRMETDMVNPYRTMHLLLTTTTKMTVMVILLCIGAFPKSHGKPRVDDRRVLSGIIFINRNGLRWRDGNRGKTAGGLPRC